MASLFSSLTDLLSSTLIPTAENDSAEKFIQTSAFKMALQKYTVPQELERFVAGHLQYLKIQFNRSNLSEDETAELLEQCLICKSLNKDVSFSGIYCIQLAQSAQLWKHKVLAYQACDILLDDHSDVAILMTATLQRDLRSPNTQQICLALSCASDLVNSELFPALDPIVTERTRHPSPVVRRKAVSCLGSLIRKQPEIASSKIPALKVRITVELDITVGTNFSIAISLHLPVNRTVI